MSRPSTYLDHNASTPLRPEAVAAMRPWLEEAWANPSSTHRPGQAARHAVESARERIAGLLGAESGEIVFTSGATEACNLAVLGHARSLAKAGKLARLLVGATEHPAVLGPAEAASAEGHAFDLLPVQLDGQLDLAALDLRLAEPATLVAAMAANNETGVLHPVALISQRAARAGALFFCDVAQALGKVPVKVSALGADLAAASAHKFGGPKGVGFLYKKKGVKLQPLAYGGDQEGGLRPGTEDVAGIVGMAAALEAAVGGLEAEAGRLAVLRGALEAGIFRMAPEAVVNGAGAPRVPGTLSVSLPGLESEALLIRLDQAGVHLSSGSACAAGAVQPSHVLQAMGASAARQKGVLRFSLGWSSRPVDVEAALAALGEALKAFGVAGILKP